MAEQNYNDDYFINLVMDFNNVDEEIYTQWANWCANSGYRYYISIKDGKFYTAERSKTEIAREAKKKELMDFVSEQKKNIKEEELNKFLEYEQYIRSLEMDEDFLTIEPKTFKEWLG